jgi:protein required for attachment to host cells
MANAKITAGTHILVADGEKALLLENRGDAQDLNLHVAQKEEHPNPATRDQGTDRPGRNPDTGVGQRSALDDTDWHKFEKERFADELAEMLYKKVHAGRIERLVLIASPLVLGELRDKLHKEVQDRILGELPKTLTNHPVDQIEKALADGL